VRDGRVCIAGFSCGSILTKREGDVVKFWSDPRRGVHFSLAKSSGVRSTMGFMQPFQTDEAAVTYAQPRDLTPQERKHPLAESGWHVLAHTTMDGEVDSLLIEKHGKHRLLELFEEGYDWARERHCLKWQDFVTLETERGDRKGWLEAIHQKLEVYGHAVPEPKVWVARNDDYGADWLLALEF
jgi:hypothetical protein